MSFLWYGNRGRPVRSPAPASADLPAAPSPKRFSPKDLGCTRPAATRGQGPRETAEDRALSRFLSNRLKRQGTLVPPSPSPCAPVLDTTVLATFVREQLRHGITDEAQVLPRSSDAAGLQSAGEGAAGEQSAGKGSKAGAGAVGKVPRKGVIIAPPARIPDAARTVPVPQPAPRAPGTVHVFWDVQGAHPGAADPRVVARELLRVASHWGRVAGCYVYGTRPAWAWVPSYFVENYAGREEPVAREAGAGAGTGRSGKETAAEAAGRRRCGVCGAVVVDLEAHMRQLHPDRAPAAGTAGAAGAAAAAGSRAVTVGASHVKGGVVQNTYRTGLGNVKEYWSSSGEKSVPTAGHQLTLKYCLKREGCDPRVVQNADGATDRAVNGGVDRLLAGIRTRAALTGPAAMSNEVTVVLVSSSERHGAVYSQCRVLGIRTVVVRPGGSKGPGRGGAGGRKGAGRGALEGEDAAADVELSWELVVGGAYQLHAWAAVAAFINYLAACSLDVYDPTLPPCHQWQSTCRTHGEASTRAPLPHSTPSPTATQLYHHRPALCPQCYSMAREAMQLPQTPTSHGYCAVTRMGLERMIYGVAEPASTALGRVRQVYGDAKYAVSIKIDEAQGTRFEKVARLFMAVDALTTVLALLVFGALVLVLVLLWGLVELLFVPVELAVAALWVGVQWSSVQLLGMVKRGLGGRR